MPALTANKNVASGDGFDFTSNAEVYTIDRDVTLSVDDGDGVASSFKSDEIANYGVINAPANLLEAAVYLTNSSNFIFNAADASLAGADGIASTGSDDLIINDGSITGIIAGMSVGQDATVDNSGQIFGQSNGIEIGAGAQVRNTGTISSDGTALSLTTASGSGGEISVTNSGLIQGGSSIASSGAGDLAVTNDGQIDGNIALANSGGDSFTNTGTIDGSVQLGNGTNTFDSRHGGAVTGTITGGSGADTIYLGNGDETVNGGAGHDQLFGGSGADTFAFTSVLAVDTDKIVGFNVAADTIQLDHTEFVGLTAGTTPVFSIGASPTSASDHLYYNSTTGWLYYDADGTGSKPSHGFANVGAGLHLTAKDFTVV